MVVPENVIPFVDVVESQINRRNQCGTLQKIRKSRDGLDCVGKGKLIFVDAFTVVDKDDYCDLYYDDQLSGINTHGTSRSPLPKQLTLPNFYSLTHFLLIR